MNINDNPPHDNSHNQRRLEDALVKIESNLEYAKTQEGDPRIIADPTFAQQYFDMLEKMEGQRQLIVKVLVDQF
jgi:hypothetical protein